MPRGKRSSGAAGVTPKGGKGAKNARKSTAQKSADVEEVELKLENVKCPACMTILIEPVTFPCSHRMCSSCWKSQLQESFSCPCCRRRLSYWSRSVSKSKEDIVDRDLWDKIQAKFPKAVEIKIKGGDEGECAQRYPEDFPDEDSSINHRDIVLSEPGQVRQDLESSLKMHEADLNRKNMLESEASEDYIRKIVEEEEKDAAEAERIRREQEEADEELARKLQAERDVADEAERKKVQEAKDLEFARKLQAEEDAIARPRVSPKQLRRKPTKVEIKPSKGKKVTKNGKKDGKKGNSSQSSNSSNSQGGSQRSIKSFTVTSTKRKAEDELERSNPQPGPSTSSNGFAQSFVPFLLNGSNRKTSTETITNSSTSDEVEVHQDEEDDDVVEVPVEDEEEKSFIGEDGMEIVETYSPLKMVLPKPDAGTPDSLSSEINSHFRPIKTAPKTPTKMNTGQGISLAKPKPIRRSFSMPIPGLSCSTISNGEQSQTVTANN